MISNSILCAKIDIEWAVLKSSFEVVSYILIQGEWIKESMNCLPS